MPASPCQRGTGGPVCRRTPSPRHRRVCSHLWSPVSRAAQASPGSPLPGAQSSTSTLPFAPDHFFVVLRYRAEGIAEQLSEAFALSLHLGLLCSESLACGGRTLTGLLPHRQGHHHISHIPGGALGIAGGA